ncbi:MAG: hypothetical protein ACFFEV_02935 [Candidatus Thorarchaeota archaeon]
MANGKRDAELSKVLKGIEKQLKSIHSVLAGLEERVETLEQSVGQTGFVHKENPLIYSKVLMGTLQAIEDFEIKNGHGVVAKDLAAIRNVEAPTIYDHLTKLEESNLIFWQRGAELGLKPHNAKFYSVADRKENLSDLPTLMALPDSVVPIAQAIVRASKKGITKSNLQNIVVSLKEQGEKGWKNKTSKELERELDDSLRLLMQRVLISRKRTPEDDKYYVRE